MRPLRLEMQAFGPYAQKQTLDFSEISDRAIFLIHGPTGAGKTSILDALCFALFGETSGGERSADELRSHHAGPGDVTSVDLLFLVGERRLHVVRQPAYLREKSRGTGKTLSRATANLWEVSEEGSEHPLAAGADDVTRTVENLLGLGAEEFRRVVVLPQGRFREFLAAKTKEREAILATLFRTESFRTLQLRLKEAAAALASRHFEVSGAVAVELAALDLSSSSEIEARLQNVKNEITIQTLLRAETDAEKTRRSSALQQALETHRLLGELAAAQEAWASLNKETAKRNADRERVSAAHRATGCAAAVQRWQAALSSLERWQKDLATATEQWNFLLSRVAAANARLEEEIAREPQRDAARKQLEDLKRWQDDSAGLEEARRASARESQAMQAAVARMEHAARLVKDRSENVERMRQRCLVESESSAQLLANSLINLQSAEKELTLRRQLENQRMLYRDAHSRWKALAAQRQNEEQAAAALRERTRASESRWALAAAAHLAHQLVPGQPCPVCGSEQHPAPNATPNQEVDGSLESLRAECALQEERVVTAAREEEELRAQWQRIEAGASVFTEQLGPEASRAPIHEFEIRHQKHKESHQSAQRAAQELEHVRQRLTHEESQLRTAQTEIAVLTEQTQTAQAAATAARARLEAMEAPVPAALRDAQALQKALATARTLHENLARNLELAQLQQAEAREALAAAERERELCTQASVRAATELAAADAECKATWTQHGFHSLSDWESAFLEVHARAALEEDLRVFQEGFSQATSRLRSAEEAARNLTPPDLEGLELAVQEISAVLSRLDERRGELTQTLETLESAKGRIESRQKELVELQTRHLAVGRLAKLAAGDNGSKLSLQVFVLQTLLDDVLSVASARLLQLSRGRYLLRRTETISDGRSLAGLDLEVHDEYTGQARSTASLSGGEGFLAALSLALALSDVVQSHSGGVRLDTVFVDEGFGTLDPESLDIAMNCLSALQSGGRLVGVISHVPELISRIENRLEVTPDPSGKGSRARFVTQVARPRLKGVPEENGPHR